MRLTRRLRLAFPIVPLLAVVALPVWSQENILVSIENFWDPGEIREYTQSGTLLWSEWVPSPDPAEEEDPRDLTVNNGIHVMQNLFPFGEPIQAYLSRFDGSWSHISTANWTQNWQGGVASYKNYIFATDYERSLVRFDLANSYAVERFGITADNQFALEIIDVTMGLDCRLYALEVDPGSGVPDIHVYDPDSLAHLETIDLTDYLQDFFDDFDARGIAVAQNGDIYLANTYGEIRQLDPDTTTVVKILEDVPGNWLTDIDISVDGQIVVGSRSATIAITNLALDPPSEFLITGRSTHSTWVSWSSGRDCTMVPMFTDGFENGDFSAWSSSVP